MEKAATPGAEFIAFIKDFLREGGIPHSGPQCLPLAGDGSRRAFWRILTDQGGRTFVAVENFPVDAFSGRENRAYLMIGRHLFEKGLPLPEIYGADLGKGWFILEDLGDLSLQDAVASSGERISVYKEVVQVLMELQTRGCEGFEKAWACQTPTYDHEVMRRYESDYFRDAFLGLYLGMKGPGAGLEGAFNHLADTAAGADSRFFLHRDFQSRNIMVTEHGLGILDWQGARLGPLAYDLASLLIDPYVGLSRQEQDHIYAYYLDLLGGALPSEAASFQRYYPYLALQRNLQILGAFSFLTKSMGKTYFEEYIPRAVRTLRKLLNDIRDPALGPLKDLTDALPYPE